MSLLDWNCQVIESSLMIKTFSKTCVQFGLVMVCLLKMKLQDKDFHYLLHRINLVYYDAIMVKDF